jgi:preprotein translocase subunit SecD
MVPKTYYFAGIGAVLASVLWLVIGQFLHNTRGALEAGGIAGIVTVIGMLIEITQGGLPNSLK